MYFLIKTNTMNELNVRVGQPSELNQIFSKLANIDWNKAIELSMNYFAQKVAEQLPQLLEPRIEDEDLLPANKMYSIEETCAIIGKKRGSLYKYRNQGKLVPDGKSGRSPMYSGKVINEYLHRKS